MSDDPVAAAVARAFREEWASVLATLIRHVGNFQLAEDAVQDAFAAAIVAWERDGVPANPGAWITVTARRGGTRTTGCGAPARWPIARSASPSSSASMRRSRSW